MNVSSWMLLSLLLLAPTLSASAAPASAPTSAGAEEARLVEEMFGKQITDALATPDVQDNVQVAGDLLKAAQDESHPPALRLALVQQTLRLLREVLTPEASRIIHSCLVLQQQLQSMDTIQEVQAELDIFTARYAFARKVNGDLDVRLNAAREVLALSLQLAKLQGEAGKFDAASATLMSARQTARAAKLSQEDIQIDEALQQVSQQKSRAARLVVLQQKLAAAKQAGEGEQIRAAQVQLGLFCLQAEGDLKRSAAELAGTNHSYELPLKAVADFLDDPRNPPPPEVCNSIAEAMIDMAKSAEGAKALTAIVAAGRQLCQASMAQNSQGLASAKTKLLLMQLEKLTAESPSEHLVRVLRAAYGSFEGRLEKSATGQNVTITYDFSTAKQLADWDLRSGKWDVATRSGVVSAPSTMLCRLETRLRFRGNQPLTLTFQASGKQDLDAWFTFRSGGENHVEFMFGHQDRVNPAPVHMVRCVTRLMYSIKAPADSSQNNRFCIAWDGHGGFAWSVNGKEITHVSVDPDFARMPLAVSLVSMQQPSSVKDVKIDGVVIENPNAPASAPASAPAGP